jgi:hypothetical protein
MMGGGGRGVEGLRGGADQGGGQGFEEDDVLVGWEVGRGA